MIYTCAKCKFLFERKNEPSKCPSCENLNVMAADENEREAYKRTLETQRTVANHANASLNNPK